MNVTVDYEGRIFHGLGMSTDILEAAALALINASNVIMRAKKINKSRNKGAHLNRP